MSMTLLDPGGRGGSTDRTLAPRLDDVAGRSIGLLSNGKLNADVLLEETAQILQAQFGGSVLPMVAKGSAGAPAPADMLKKLSLECDYLITASGD